jgi:thiosulfate dehydrogenase [quinone] large subunit
MPSSGYESLTTLNETDTFARISRESGLVLFFRLALGWMFLVAGVTQLLTPHFSIVPFLSNTKTFHSVMILFATPVIAPAVSFLVEWGQTLIGLSLISGCLVRISAYFGAALMLIYYCAHMDWPYIQYNYNLVIDFHLVYAGLLVYIAAKRAGHIWGLDGLLRKTTA